MKETGRIIRVEGETAVVRLDAGDGCASCGVGCACRPSGPRGKEMRLDLEGRAFHPDDLVEIETPGRSLLTAAFLVFILPLILSVAAYFIVQSVYERIAPAAFFGSFILAEGLVFLIDRVFGRNRFFQPRITGVIGGRIGEDRPGQSTHTRL